MKKTTKKSLEALKAPRQGYLNKLRQIVDLRNTASRELEDPMDSFMNNYVEQSIPPLIKDFIRLKFGNSLEAKLIMQEYFVEPLAKRKLQ